MSRPALAIELSQRDGSVAIGDGSNPPILREFPSAAHSDSDALMPEIDAIVRGAGFAPRDLGAVIVSIGPGSFTGLRIAVTTAKLLSECLSISIVAVPSALVAAASAKGPAPRLVALASKRSTVWLTIVDGDGANVRGRGEARIIDASELRDAANGARTLLADEYVPEALVALARDVGLAIETPTLRADACLAIGLAMLARGENADPSTLTPLYPREPEAVTLWRERRV